jgi:protein TonB
MDIRPLRVRRTSGLALTTLLLAFGVLPATRLSAQSAPAPVRVGGAVKPPTRLTAVAPTYPPVARQARTQGVVILETTIGTDGKVKATKVVKSVPMLDEAAQDAVKKWEYQPTIIDGKPTPVIMVIPVNFKLD